MPLAAAYAATETVTATLSSGAETPPNDSKGTGTLTGTYDPSSRKLTYDVTYENLTGPATMAHFHAPAPAGKSAGVEVPIKGSVASPITGEVTLNETDAKNLTDGAGDAAARHDRRDVLQSRERRAGQGPPRA